MWVGLVTVPSELGPGGSELCGAFQAEGTTSTRCLRHEGPHGSKAGSRGHGWGEDQSRGGGCLAGHC